MATKKASARKKAGGKVEAHVVTIGQLSNAIGTIANWASFVQQALDSIEPSTPILMEPKAAKSASALTVYRMPECKGVKIYDIGCPAPWWTIPSGGGGTKPPKGAGKGKKAGK